MPNSIVLQRVMAVGLSAAVVLSLTGAALLAPLAASAQTIVDGDLIRASNGFDVYIVKLVGSKKFRRLILNPDIFNSYGHLDWNNIKVVDQSVVDGYVDSQLVRNIDGTRVYQLIPNGEDSGDKHWLNMTAEEFVADGYDWDAIYQINAFEEDLYVSGSDILVGGAAPVLTGPVSASLSPNSSAAATTPKLAENVPFGTWRFSGTGTIDSLTFTRKGVGAPGDFVGVYLYDGNQRLTSSRVVNTSSNQVTFGSLSLAVNGARDLSLRAELSGSSGNVHYFELSSASDVSLVGGSSAGGSYPVAANAMTLAGQDAGVITAAKSGSVANPFVGAKNVELSRFTLAGTTEDGRVRNIRLINSGTLNTIEVTNVYAQIDSTTVTAMTNGGSDDAINLEFTGAGYLLEKGKTKTVRVYGDVGGERDETLILYVEESPDVWAVGQTYGFGMQTTITGFDSSATGESHNLTLQGGNVTIAFNGPNASDIGDDTDDTPFLDLAVTAAANVDVRKTQMHLCFYNAGTLADMTTAVLAEIEDTKIVDADSGLTLNGPVDGSSWSVEAAATTSSACTTSNKSGTYTFTEDWGISTGQTRNISFRLDMKVNTAINDSGNDQFKGVLEGWGDLAGTSGDLTVMRYADSNNAVKSAEIVPSGDVSGNQLTVKKSSLAAARASTPVSDTYIKGEKGVDVVGIVFTAGQASAMTITDITLGAHVSDDATTATASYTNGDETDGLGPDNILPSVWLVDGSTLATVSSIEGYSDNSGTDDEVKFTSLNFVVPAGQSKTLLVRGDVATTAPSGSASDGIFFDIDAVADVTAIDDDGNTRNLDAANPLDGDVIATIASAGTLSISAGNDTPTSAIVVMGTAKNAMSSVGSGYHVSDFQADATNEPFDVNKVTLENIGSGGQDNVLEMAFDYQDSNGTWRRAIGQPDGAGELTLTLIPAWRIPKDDSASAKAYVSVGERADGADSTDQVKVKISVDASADDQFEAFGSSSGSKLDDDDVSEVTAINAHHVFNTKPTFSFVGGVGSSGHVGATLVAAANQKVATFKIAADAHHEVLFTSASGSLEFDLTASGDGTSGDVKLFKSDGTLLASITVADSAATFAFTFEDANLTVPAGGSVELYVEANLTGYNDTDDNFGIRLNRDEADNVKWLDEDNTSFDVVRSGPADVIPGLPIDFGTAVK